MKKSQPSPHTPPETLYTQVQKSKPPHTQKQIPEKPIYENLNIGRKSAPFRESLEEKIVYADIQLQTAYPPFKRRPEEDIIYADIKKEHTTKPKVLRETLYTIGETLQSEITPLSNEEHLKKVKSAPLVRAYVKNVHRWSETVYGNKNALQDRIEAIVKNPSLGEDISWQIITHPESFGDLAGRNLWGRKSAPRRQAEEGIRFLSAVVEGLTEAVKYTQEELSLTSQTKQMRHEASRKGATNLQGQQRTSPPERRIAPLSQETVARMLHDNTAVQRFEARIEHWCAIVYGNKSVLQKQIKEIQKNPEEAEEVSWQVGAYPKSVGKLRGKNLCGLKNSARRHAENGISHLCDAIENYGEAVKQVKEALEQSHKEQHRHQETTSSVNQDLYKQKTVSRLSQKQEQKVAQLHPEAAGPSRHQQPPALPPKVREIRKPNTESEKHQQPPALPPKIRGAKNVAFAV